MKRVYSFEDASAILPLIRAIAAEFVERRKARRTLHRERAELEDARTPEGLSQNLAELDARIYEHDQALRSCREEFEALGMTVLRNHPLTVHIPGQSRSGPVTFCWEEGEDALGHGHEVGHENEQRRQLRLKAS